MVLSRQRIDYIISLTDHSIVSSLIMKRYGLSREEEISSIWQVLDDAAKKEIDDLYDNEVDTFFRDTSDPSELCLFAANWNLDNGDDVLRLVLDHQACNRASASVIYWLTNPTFFQQYGSVDEVPSWARDRWDLIQRIHADMAAGKYPAGAIDPVVYQMLEPSDPEPPDAKWQIPQVFHDY